MSLSSSVIATGLRNLTPTVDAAAAIQEFAAAYGDYMKGAVGAGVSITTTASATTAMANAMAFPVPGTAASAAAVIVGGVQAFWGVLIAAPATHFLGAIAIASPPGIATMGATLASALASNVGMSLADAATAIGGVLHARSSLGGTVTFNDMSATPIY